MSIIIMAQEAIVDIPQTVVLESGQLQLNVISAEASNGMFQLAIVDDSGNQVSQSIVTLSEPVEEYDIQLPIGFNGNAWLEIRTGNEKSATEIYILPRPTQLSNTARTTASIEMESPAQMEYGQEEEVCYPGESTDGNPIYLSASDQLFGGVSIEFQSVEPWINYPIEIEDGTVSQALILDQSQMKGMPISKEENSLILTIYQSNIGSQPVALNKLSNTILAVKPVSSDYKSERYLDFNDEAITYLANQLLIAELIEAPIERVKATTPSSDDQSWQSMIGKPAIDVDPRDYVDFDDVDSFIDEVVKNVRIYQTGEDSNGSYVYPIQTSQSIRQPLYLIDNRVSTVDQLLNMDQRKINRIRVYTDVGLLTTQIGPSASAGLVIVSTEAIDNPPIFSVGDSLYSTSESKVGTLSPTPFAGQANNGCYQHNERLGDFRLRLITLKENGLEQQESIIKVNKKTN